MPETSQAASLGLLLALGMGGLMIAAKRKKTVGKGVVSPLIASMANGERRGGEHSPAPFSFLKPGKLLTMRPQSRYVMLAVCIVLGTFGFAGRGSSQTDEARQVSGLTGKELVDFKANMDEVRVYDKQIYGSKDVSAEEAKRMTTKELITQTSRLNLFLLPMLYDDPKIGMYRASRCSNSMAELRGRKDFTTAFLQAYSSFDPNPKTHPHFEAEGGVFATGWMLSLEEYPPLQSQSAGHEKEILLGLCKKYREMQKVNASYPKGQGPYGPGCFELGPAQRYAKKVFPNARILSVHSDKDMQIGSKS